MRPVACTVVWYCSMRPVACTVGWYCGMRPVACTVGWYCGMRPVACTVVWYCSMRPVACTVVWYCSMRPVACSHVGYCTSRILVLCCCNVPQLTLSVTWYIMQRYIGRCIGWEDSISVCNHCLLILSHSVLLCHRMGSHMPSLWNVSPFLEGGCRYARSTSWLNIVPTHVRCTLEHFNAAWVSLLVSVSVCCDTAQAEAPNFPVSLIYVFLTRSCVRKWI